MGILEKLVGTIQTESEVNLTADKSLFVLIAFIFIIVLAGYTIVKVSS